MANEPQRVWKGTDEPIRKGKIVNQVYETSDYSIFRLHKRNRNVITRSDMLEQAREGIVNPIMVNAGMIVIDGQNRLHHSIKAGVPVKYIIDENLTIDDITRMNTNQEKWSLKDWIESYANEGRTEYEKLIYILNNHYPDVGLVASIGMNTLSTSTSRDSVKSGNFKFHNYEKTISFFQYLKRFKKETSTDNNASVTQSLYELFRLKKFDGDRLIKKVLSKGLDEEMRIKKLTKSGMLESFLDTNNDRLSPHSSSFINYYKSSKKQIIITDELQEWAKNKSVEETDK